MTIIVISSMFGVVVALVAWHACSAIAQVPEEDRHYLDRPALGFRVVWPLIRYVVFYLGFLYSPEKIEMTQARLRRAGVDFSLSPQQYLASMLVAALVSGTVMFLVGLLVGRGFHLLGLLAAVGGYMYPELWLREKTQQRSTAILRSLPFYLDVVTLAIEAGTNLTGGLTQAVQKTADTPLRRELSRVLRDIRSGRTRADALRDLSNRTGSPAIRNVVTGLIQAERTGASLAPILRSQAMLLRSQRFQQAEKKAMEAPVKLLAPLIMFIFPTTGLVIGFIILSKAIQEGLVTWAPLVWAYHWPG